MQLDLGAILCSKQKVSRILALESMYKIGDENLHHLSQTKSVSVTWKFAAKFETLKCEVNALLVTRFVTCPRRCR